MKTWTKVTLTVAALLLSSALSVADWKPVKLDTVHSRIGFTASTLLFDVHGSFTKYDVQVDGDPAKLPSVKVSVSIDAASIDTHNVKRDEHLMSPDFLDVKKYPKITFVSESISQSGNTVTVTGTFDLHGHKKKVTIPFKKASGKNGAGVDTTAFKGTLQINRNDYGVGSSNVAAKISLEDTVVLEVTLVTFLS